MNQDDDDYDEEEMDPEQKRAFGDVVDRCFEELVVVQRSGAGVEVDRENQEDREESDGVEYGEAFAFDQEELSGVGAAVAGDLATRGVPDGEELGEEGGGTGDPAVVAAELHGEDDPMQQMTMAERKLIRSRRNGALRIGGGAVPLRSRQIGDCAADENRSAYKKLALQRHPDKLVQSGLSHAEATAQFQELAQAYKVLSDLKERTWYDLHQSQIIFSDLNSNSVAPNSAIPNLFSFFSIPRSLSIISFCLVLHPNHDLLDEMAVSELINPETHVWRTELIHLSFHPDDAEAICRIQLSRRQVADSIIWSYNKNGNFSVKSAYKVARKIQGEVRAESSASTADRLTREELELFWVQAWFAWNQRNRVLFGGTLMDPRILNRRAEEFLTDYKAAQVQLTVTQNWSGSNYSE
ncbi:hypothetical protein SO802_015142 [Lithocarpus litseifolius]|uniref:J domain-containing protein n=1 Tax=Lithocarpus litseifolius TaxID=425828 RepID=A0AAW2CTD2_9ROSI